jgi:hypothetical protein
MWLSGLRHTPVALPLEKACYALHSRLGGTQGQSRQLRKNSPPLGIDPQTVQSVVCCYAARAILAHTLLIQTILLPHLGGFGGLVVSMLTSGTQDRGLAPSRSRQIFWAKKSSACLPSEGK